MPTELHLSCNEVKCLYSAQHEVIESGATWVMDILLQLHGFPLFLSLKTMCPFYTDCTLPGSEYN